jgi:FMN-dependent NADH-azoreductase
VIGDPLADSHCILKRWKNYFSQLLNVHGVSDVRQVRVEIHTAEPLVRDLVLLKMELLWQS